MDSNTKCSMTPGESPLLLTHVCHRWRELAISSPSLWASVSINIPSYPSSHLAHGPLMRDATEEEEELLEFEDEVGAAAALDIVRSRWQRAIGRSTELVRLWLKRGRGYPLSVSVILNDKVVSSGVEAVGDLLSLICEHAPRWTHLDLFCAGPFPGEFLSLTTARLTRLRSFSLNCRDDMSVAPTFPPDSFTNATTLRQLCLHSPRAIFDTLVIQWGNITQLSLSGGPSTGVPCGITSSRALAILKNCPALVQCQLYLGDSFQGSLASTQAPYRVLLPHLQRLVISESSQNSSTRTFFDFLDMGMVPPPAEPSHLLLLQRWGDRIRSIEFGYWPMLTVSNLIQALELTPNVEELTVDLSSIGTRYTPLWQGVHDRPIDGQLSLHLARNWLLRNFEVGANERPQPLCPNLRSVRFSVSFFGDIAAKAISRLVRSRQQGTAGIAQLQSLIVRFRSSPYGGHNAAEEWSPPPRWRESQLNKLCLGERTIGVEWLNIVVENSKQRTASRRGSQRADFESWWDHQSRSYRSYKL
ncbi:hypothetical protein BKA70DRAFT_1319305 [Coprinopsis sp. MPI-PUGE-AT-0042]|nr:hypothetical protein BKA70DRAFT_1319305 [Coprinopsis sp. MPI-PUGE-AT-0042]